MMKKMVYIRTISVVAALLMSFAGGGIIGAEEVSPAERRMSVGRVGTDMGRSIGSAGRALGTATGHGAAEFGKGTGKFFKEFGKVQGRFWKTIGLKVAEPFSK